MKRSIALCFSLLLLAACNQEEALEQMQQQIDEIKANQTTQIATINR